MNLNTVQEHAVPSLQLAVKDMKEGMNFLTLTTFTKLYAKKEIIYKLI